MEHEYEKVDDLTGLVCFVVVVVVVVVGGGWGGDFSYMISPGRWIGIGIGKGLIGIMGLVVVFYLCYAMLCYAVRCDVM